MPQGRPVKITADAFCHRIEHVSSAPKRNVACYKQDAAACACSLLRVFAHTFPANLAAKFLEPGLLVAWSSCIGGEATAMHRSFKAGEHARLYRVHISDA